MAANNVDIVVRAKNEASSTLKQVKADLSGLDGGAKALAGGLAGIGAAVGIGAVVGLATQAGAAIADMSRQAEQVDQLSAAFRNLATDAGQSSVQMLDAMRTASQGAISDSELMLSANRAMMLGVADSAGEMAQLLEVAAVRGKAMGLSTAQAFSDLVTGIGRMSPLILDNLGIVTGGEKVFDDYAKTLGTTAAALTDTQRKQALLNQVISQTNTSALPAVSQFERMDAAIENAKVAMGQLFGPAVSVIAQNLADAANALTDATTATATEIAQATIYGSGSQIQEQIAEVENLRALLDFKTLQGGDAQALANLQEQLAYAETYLDGLVISYNEAATVLGGPIIDTEAIKQGEIALTNAAAATEGLTQATGDAEAAATLASYSFVRMASGLSQVQAQAGATAGIIYNLTGAVNALNASTGVMQANSDLLGQFTPQINGITSGLIGNLGIDAALAKGEELKRQTADRIEQLRAEHYTSAEIELILQSEVAETQKWAGSLDNVSAATAAINQEFEDLKGKVSGVLTDALNVDMGDASIDKLLPREDAVNENARRLAAIMNEGLANQPWLEEFKNEVPGIFAEIASAPDARVAAAKIMQDFQAGMRPELIDKEAAKAKVKAMILGEQNMAALAEEIAAELAAEMNIPLSQAMAAAGGALGVKPQAGQGGEAGAAPAGPDMTSAGASASASFVAGFEANANGAVIVASIITKMEANYTQLTASGAKAGTNWGAGFMSTVETGVAQPLISLLATLVLPEVVAQLKQNQTQSEAP